MIKSPNWIVQNRTKIKYKSLTLSLLSFRYLFFALTLLSALSIDVKLLFSGFDVLLLLSIIKFKMEPVYQ